LSLVVWKLNVAQEFVCYFDKRLLWPGHEPINSSVVDKSGVLTAVVSESLADGAHANRQMHVVFDSVEEEFVHRVRGLIGVASRLVGLCDFFANAS
jgi:hypothetical protein